VPTDIRAQDTCVTLNGLRFHYRDWGNEGAQPLILLHGINSHARSWDTFARAMASDYHVLALDARGHGETEWALDYTADLMTEDTLAFVSTLGLRRPTLLGLSMGGVNGYLHAARHPDAVERLVIVGVGPDVTENLRARRSDFDRNPAPGWPPVVVDLAEARRLARTEPPLLFDDPEAAYEAARRINARPPEAEHRARIFNGLVQRDDGRWTFRYDPVLRSPLISMFPNSSEQWALVSRITCPTLLVRGVDCGILSRETAQRMRREIPTCRLVEVPNAGHPVPLDNPSGFLDAVRPFLVGDPLAPPGGVGRTRS
jgi:pimeloyl-ACP methyl ester carboxylesterase